MTLAQTLLPALPALARRRRPVTILSPCEFATSQPSRFRVECAALRRAGVGPKAMVFKEVHAHDGQLKAYLRGSFPSVRDVDDVVQESYLRIWKRQAQKPIESVKSFLFQIARRLAIDVLREKHRRKTDALGDLTDLAVIDDRPSAVDLLSYDEKVTLFAAALTRLPDRCREIFILRKLKGVPQKGVAAQLGISERTVESQITRGMSLLEQDLRAHGIDGFCHDESRSQSAPRPGPKLAPTDWVVKAGAVDDVLDRMNAMLRYRRRRRKAAAAASAAAGLCLVLAFWLVPLFRDTSTVVTPSAQRQALTLHDGSQAELNARTSVHTDFRYGRRHIELDRGEAYFSVVKDPARPFLVETPAGTVRVTGTRFNVRVVGGDRVEVTLLEGAVTVTPASVASQQTLVPGQFLALTEGKADLRTLTPVQLENRTAWREGRVVFDGDALADAAARFADFHGVIITVAPAVASLRLGGSYPLAELKEFLEALETTLPVRVVRGEGSYRVVPR